MERYHIFKLGLAILFYAAYCARPMLVYSLGADNQIQSQPRSQPVGDYNGYYQGLDGQPGIDFPVYSYIPRTSFSCRGVESGYYADLETNCQVFHICEANKKVSFLCPNGTIFQQSELICEWWNKVNCSNSPSLYESSAERLQNEIAKRKISRRVNLRNGDFSHGAVMRMEERSSVTATKNGKNFPVQQEAQRRRNQNNRMPENHDIEFNIASEESNNRHLARANVVQQNKHENHRYEERKENVQVRKDISRDTGNFANGIDQQNYKNYNNAFPNTNKLQNHRIKDENFDTTQNPNNFGSQTSTARNNQRGQTTFQTSSYSNSVTPNYNAQNNAELKANSSPNYKIKTSVAQNNYQQNSNNNQNFQNNKQPSKNNFQQNKQTIQPQNYENQNHFNHQTETTPRSSSVNPTNQLFGQKTNFVQNYVSSSTQNYQNTHNDVSQTPRPQRYTAKFNTQTQNTQTSVSSTTPNYPQNQNHQNYVKSNKNSQIKSTFTNQARYFGDGTTRPIPKTSQNGVQNLPVHVGNYQKISTTQTSIQKIANKVENSRNDFSKNVVSQVPVHIGNIYVPEGQRQTFVVPPRQAEGISVAPQKAESLFIPPRSAQSLSLQSLNTPSFTSPVQRPQIFVTSSQTFLSTTPTAKPDSHAQGKNINHRGNTRFNANDFDDGQPQKYNDQKTPKRNIQHEENYELDFPKHKSELKSIQQSDSDESQIPQESASFVRSPFNSINNNYKTSVGPYPNHRSTYSDIIPKVTFEAPKITSISSITPHLVTTQPINNGKPFVGSKVGSTLLPNKGTSTNGATYLPMSSTTRLPTTHEIILGVLRHSSTTVNPYGPPETLNLGERDKTLPPIKTETKVTKSVPTDLFNLGKTDIKLQPKVVATYFTPTTEPLNIYVPDEGSLNFGANKATTTIPKEVFEPPFVKKFAPLLYASSQQLQTTPKTVDHAVVYGTFASSSPKIRDFISSTTERPNNDAELISTRNSNNLNEGVSIRFNKGQDKVNVHLTKTLGDQNIIKQSPVFQNSNEYVRISAGKSLKNSASLNNNGFLITKSPNYNIAAQNNEAPSKSSTQKPRPFAKSLDLDASNQHSVTPTYATYPSYSLSSARPFEISKTTEATPITRNFVYDNLDSMLNVLKEIAEANNKNKKSDRSGLVIPPSVSPQTLHSLAQYFANELDSEKQILDPDIKEEFTGLLTQMTVHGYNTLFRRKTVNNQKEESSAVSTPSNSFDATSTTETPTFSTIFSTSGTDSKLSSSTFATPSRGASALDENETTNEVQAENDLASTLEPPVELRQLARNFSLALSSYLKDPENFKKNLEELRPTEPPALEGDEQDNSNSESGDEELLNFSDADLKSSTPFYYPSSPSPPSPTWGYILANAPKGSSSKDSLVQNTAKSVLQDEVKNSLNPDLNTADSQSLNPSYNNNFGANEEKKRGRTEFPPNSHWTSSPEATKLWQKTLSVNPLSVNDNLITTPLAVTSSETTETYSDDSYNFDHSLPKIDEPSSEISYELKTLPPLNINSSQIHGILIDFMNHTKDNQHNRLQRILKKLNTSEDEFLSRMREIESNPLTKRLILLLISECGANITNNLGSYAEQNHENVEILNTDYSSANVVGNMGDATVPRSPNLEESVNSSLVKLVDPKLKAEDQDTRALQLLNALYGIASRFGKK